MAQGAFLGRSGLAARTARLAAARPDQAAALREAADRLAAPARMGALFKALCAHRALTPRTTWICRMTVPMPDPSQPGRQARLLHQARRRVAGAVRQPELLACPAATIRALVAQNRALVAASLGVGAGSLLGVTQVHGSDVMQRGHRLAGRQRRAGRRDGDRHGPAWRSA